MLSREATRLRAASRGSRLRLPRRGGAKHVWGIRPAGLPVRRLPPGEGREEGAKGEQVGSSLVLHLSSRARWRPRNSPVPPGGRSKRRDDPWPVGRRQSAVGSQRIASGDFDCRLLSANCLVTAAVSQLGVGSAGGPPSSNRFEAGVECHTTVNAQPIQLVLNISPPTVRPANQAERGREQ